MFILPDALAALAQYRQFIVYKLVPTATKLNKVPIDWRTGHVANAHDPAIWLSATEAAALAEALGPEHGVGFVFTRDDPFWFIDIDKCLLPDGSGWSARALELVQRFAGAAFEISVSGYGLHGFGCGRAPEPRKYKYGVEFDLYTEGRFVALTGTSIVGNIWTDHTPALAALVRDYLQPDADAPVPTDWTTEAVTEWNGPLDDTELIQRAMRSVSAGSAFGSKAAFADLWTASADVLVKCYPKDQGDGYDESKADSALAQHLAFWTGKNCERIQTIMQRSALVREKWSREDYLPRTILGVVARQVDVLTDKPPEVLASLPPPPNAITGKIVTGDTFLSVAEQLNLFRGCAYVCNVHRVLVPGGYLLKPEQFKVMFGGYSFPMDPENTRVSRNAWEAFTESQCFRSPRADGICFRPEREPGEIIEEAGVKLANVWWPVETLRVAGDAGPFIRHVAKMFPDTGDQAKLFAYLAALVQNPGCKFQWAPLLQGIEGNGKTLIISAVRLAVGDRYTHLPNAADLGGNGTKFNAWLYAKLFIGIEEIKTDDRREMLEALKPLITNSRVEIQGKGQDQVTGDNRANIIACTNYKDAIPLTLDGRRWAVWYAAQQNVEDLERDGMTGNYFPDLYDWFEGRNAYAASPPGYAIVNDFLRSYTIPDELNPAVSLHRAPVTSATAEAITASLGAVEQEVQEAIEQGNPGFAGGWVSSMMLDRLLVRLKADRRIPPRKRRSMMVELGYDWHPALDNGRSVVSVQPDGGRPRLFIRKGHILSNLSDPRVVAKKYVDDQNSAMAEKANFGG